MKCKKNTLAAGFAIATVVSLLVFEYGAVTYSGTPIQLMLFFAYLRLQIADEGTVNTEGGKDLCQVSKQL